MSSPPRVSQNWEILSEYKPGSSSSSRCSTRSHISLAAVEARAKAEAARTKADYTRRQIEMKVERARIDAMLFAMQEEGEAESALAAAKTLETAVNAKETEDKASITNHLALSVQPEQRTEEYINAHFDHHDNHTDNQPAKISPKESPDDHSHPQSTAVESQALSHPQPPLDPPDFYTPPPQAGALNPFLHTAQYTDQSVGRYHDKVRSNPFLQSHADVFDLTAHLARRDLLTAGLKVFDNRPENYLSWRASYHNVTQGLNLKASEELDLLTRWLGGESLQHATRIRAVHINCFVEFCLLRTVA